jgi:hypothetical protein
MHMVYLNDGAVAAPIWAGHLSDGCSLSRRVIGPNGNKQDDNQQYDKACTGRPFIDALPIDTELAVIEMSADASLHIWLAALEYLPRDCPKVAIADLSAYHVKALLIAGLDAVLPPQMPADVLAAQLVAFVRLRRKYHPVARHGPVQFYSHAKRALVAERDLQLTAREYDILHFIAQANGRPVGAAELLRIIFGLNFDPGTNIAAVHIYRLRKKLADLGFAHLLQTVQGRGYRLALM